MSAAYDLYLEAHAAYTGQTLSQIEQMMTEADFETHLRELHERYLNGEFSIGKFTELMGVAHLELWEILESLNLPYHA